MFMFVEYSTNTEFHTRYNNKNKYMCLQTCVQVPARRLHQTRIGRLDVMEHTRWACISMSTVQTDAQVDENLSWCRAANRQGEERHIARGAEHLGVVSHTKS